MTADFVLHREGERDSVAMRGEDYSYSVLLLSVCLCFQWMEDRLRRVCVTEDQQILIARYTHTQCHGSADPEISRSVTRVAFRGGGSGPDSIK